MQSIYSSLHSLLKNGESVVLATIAEHNGSTPREHGAQMLIRHDASIIGTIGGGLLEACTMLVAGQLLNLPCGAGAFCHFLLDNEDAAKAAMVCGGTVSVVLEHIGTDNERLLLVEKTWQAEERGDRLFIKSSYTWDSTALLNASLPTEGHATASKCTVRVMQHLESAIIEGASTDSVKCWMDANSCSMVVSTTPKSKLFIVGAGHVAQPTAQLAHMVGFAVTVLDDRDEFANAARFPTAQTLVLSSYDKVFEKVQVTAQSYIAIMTRGHLHDGVVLQKALQTPAYYIGMIGSRKKRDALYAKLRNEGVQDVAIARCKCPIGISIGGQSPEEIAVSIVAELIQARASAV